MVGFIFRIFNMDFPQDFEEWQDQDIQRSFVIQDAYWNLKNFLAERGHQDVLDQLTLNQFFDMVEKYTSSVPKINPLKQ